jgi:hypothetical protein
MKTSLIILSAFLLAGCGSLSLEGKLDNRVVCTVAKDKLYALSEYGPVSIGARISDKDRDVICK